MLGVQEPLAMLVLLRPRLWAGSGSQARWGGLSVKQPAYKNSAEGNPGWFIHA